MASLVPARALLIGLAAQVLAPIPVALPAQDTPQRVEDLVATLGTPSFTDEVLESLLLKGSAATSHLATILDEYEEAPAPRLCAALHVLGLLGSDAGQALDNVLSVYTYGLQPEVRRQSLWAIGRIAPCVRQSPEMACRKALATIEAEAGTEADWFLFAAVSHRLRLGPTPTGQRLAEIFSEANCAAVVAACWATEALSKQDAGELLPDIEELLYAELEHTTRPWDMAGTLAYAIPDLGEVLWRRGVRNETAARGVLRHWDWKLRVDGVAYLGKEANSSEHARYDVILHAADMHTRVREESVAAALRWRDRAWICLPMLAIQADGPSSPWTKQCAVASRQTIDLCEARGTRAALQLLQAVVNGEHVKGEADVAEPADQRAVASFVMGCRGVCGVKLAALADACRENGWTDDKVVEAFVWCLGTSDRMAWGHAAMALTRLGPVVAHKLPDFTTVLMRSSRASRVPLRAIPVVDAWVHAGSVATRQDLVDAISHDRWYVVRRALLEMSSRGITLSTDEKAVVERSLARTYERVDLEENAIWLVNELEAHSRRAREDVDYARLQAAGGLALLCGGGRWDAPGLLAACSDVFGVRRSEVKELMATAHEAGRLDKLSEAAERDMTLNVLQDACK